MSLSNRRRSVLAKAVAADDRSQAIAFPANSAEKARGVTAADVPAPDDPRGRRVTRSKERALASLGRSWRKGRVQDARVAMQQWMRMNNPDTQAVSDHAIRRRVDEWFTGLAVQPDLLAAQIRQLDPTSVGPEAGQRIHDKAMTHAVLRIPVMSYLKDRLGDRPRGRGRKGNTRASAAVLLWMAFGFGGPKIKHVAEMFEGNAAAGWALHYPGPQSSYTAICKQIRKICERTEPGLLDAVSVELIRQMAELRDENGNLMHPDAGKYLTVDGTRVPAHLSQDKPSTEELAALRRGARRAMARFVIYTSERSHEQDPARPQPGREVKQAWHGYKEVTISCLKLQLPIISGLYPGDVDERVAALELLAELYRLWPELPAAYLVADGLYDAEEFCSTLLFNYGIVPVTGDGNRYSKRLPYTQPNGERPGHKGTPRCDHGPMVRHKLSVAMGPEKRAKEGVAPGEQFPAKRSDLRIRFRCPKNLCKEAVTRPADDARAYSLLPRVEARQLHVDGAGNALDAHAALRHILASRRNTVEAGYAWLKSRGIAAGEDRAEWADDVGMRVFTALGNIAMTARRLAWETGLYDESLDECETLGLREAVDTGRPSAGPTSEQLAQAIAARNDQPPAPPRGRIMPASEQRIAEPAPPADAA